MAEENGSDITKLIFQIVGVSVVQSCQVMSASFPKYRIDFQVDKIKRSLKS